MCCPNPGTAQLEEGAQYRSPAVELGEFDELGVSAGVQKEGLEFWVIFTPHTSFENMIQIPILPFPVIHVCCSTTIFETPMNV